MEALTLRQSKNEIHLKHKGWDEWGRPVYEDEEGRLWKDTDPRASRPARLCTVLGNAFCGEPDIPMDVMKNYECVKVIYETRRETWG